MRRALPIAVALAAVCAAVRPVSAAFSTGCCACIANVCDAETQELPPPPIHTDALACMLVSGMGYPDFVQSCQALGGNDEPCFDPTPGVSCTVTLKEEGITCPSGPGAPAATGWELGVLALVLTALGVRSFRRRAR